MELKKLERTLLTLREAAAFLKLSERKVWAVTVPRGDLSVVRIGRSIRYSVTDLEGYVSLCRISSETEGGVR